MDTIKNYWNTLKQEFENTYPHFKIFISYDKTVPYYKKLETFLIEKKQKEPHNIDVICLLASVRQELRFGEDHCIELLTSFLKENGECLTNDEKARLYTNLGFYEGFSELSVQYLEKAATLQSPYMETYRGLGLYYFSRYQKQQTKYDLEQSSYYFQKACERSKNYTCQFSYAVTLYELKNYQQAKSMFEALLEKYPNRMRLLLAIAYCQIHLGHKESALSYLSKIQDGPDEQYHLNTDDIAEFEVFDAYYMLDEYDMFLLGCEEVLSDYYALEWEHYYYVLWQMGKKERFKYIVNKNKESLQETIQEARLDDDFDSLEEKNEYIQSYIADSQKFNAMIDSIQKGIEKPKLKLELYPEFSCFLVDCIQHNFGK